MSAIMKIVDKLVKVELSSQQYNIFLASLTYTQCSKLFNTVYTCIAIISSFLCVSKSKTSKMNIEDVKSAILSKKLLILRVANKIEIRHLK